MPQRTLQAAAEPVLLLFACVWHILDCLTYSWHILDCTAWTNCPPLAEGNAAIPSLRILLQGPTLPIWAICHFYASEQHAGCFSEMIKSVGAPEPGSAEAVTSCWCSCFSLLPEAAQVTSARPGMEDAVCFLSLHFFCWSPAGLDEEWENFFNQK